MSYFLAESEKKRVKLVSVVDGKEVSAEGTLREVSVSRHNAIYAILSEFQAIQDEWADLNTLQEKYNREYAEGKVDKQAVTEQLDKLSGLIDRVMLAVPDLHKKTADIIIAFDKEAPSIEFYKSEGFEYAYLIKLRDFFLNVPKNLKPL